MLKGFQNVLQLEDLKKRIGFTILLLAVYRLGSHIPTPGIDGQALSAFFKQSSKGSLLGMFDLFAGGGLKRATIFALGVMPYINASIITELLSTVIPHLESLKKEGEEGRKKIIQYVRYFTIVLAMVQSFGISFWLESLKSEAGMVVTNPGLGFKILTIITLSSGTAFIMWLGEQITERGIGNGISLIIFIGIISEMPGALIKSVQLIKGGQINIIIALVILVLMVLVIGAVVVLESAHRKVPIQYAKRIVGRKVYGGQSTHLPLRVDQSGVIAVIFASSVIIFPATIAEFTHIGILVKIAGWINYGTFLHTLLFVGLIIFFCYFYTAVTFNPSDIAENIKKSGGYIPGIRPGKPTAEYIDFILTRITLAGACGVAALAVLPSFLTQGLNVPFYFGGTTILIVVGVALDLMRQIESHLLMRNYDGFMKKGKLKARGN
ncbi:MAG: preprotein translocase subunit SecY [bacterium]|nr:preprotein translocase subunit SecY [bacterium]